MEYDSKQFFDDMMAAFGGSNSHQGNIRMDIACRKHELEENLDKMYANYMKGNARQLEEYFKGVNHIKGAGCKVLRNSAGKHKIVLQ